MPIPDNPQTRQEMYLNAMATGDSSGIPESPQTREEMYLDAIVKNGSGGGGGGGGSSSVLVVNDVDGTLDKTWQEIHDADIAILKIDDQIGYLYHIYSDPARTYYEVGFFTVARGTSFDDPLLYRSSTANGYPQWADD